MIANTPDAPYFAVIFTSVKNGQDPDYDDTAKLMLELAQQQAGFLGVESAREQIGITVSYWRDEGAIRDWKTQTDHAIAQRKGKQNWYSAYKVRIAHVIRDYQFSATNES